MVRGLFGMGLTSASVLLVAPPSPDGGSAVLPRRQTQWSPHSPVSFPEDCFRPPSNMEEFVSWRNCRGHRIYTVSSSSYLQALRQLASHLDWREPIGLQERLKGRSSHNGEFSVMSRSRSQGTEVTIVTGATSTPPKNRFMKPKCFQVARTSRDI